MAKRPPSSWTMGRSSGGMTGITSRTIHSGLLSELRKDSQISMRFRRRLSDFGPFSIIRTRSSAASSSMLICSRRERIASAPMPAVKVAAVAVLGLVPLLLGEELHLLEVGVARVYHDVLLVVEDGAQGGDRQVEEEAHPARDRAIEPDVRDGARELDVPHPLAPDLEVRDLDAAAVADDALVADRLEFAAVALPFLGRAEYALAEEAVFLGPQRAVVDGLGLLDLAVAPGPDHVRAGQPDHYAIKILYVAHAISPSSRRFGQFSCEQRKGNHGDTEGREESMEKKG